MIITYFVVVCLSIFYCLLIFTYVYGWHKIPQEETPDDFLPKTSVAVIVPARNEDKHIQKCLESILHQNYPPELLTVIAIDDHSEDETPHIVQALQGKYQNLQLIRLAEVLPKSIAEKLNSYKKKALEIAINQTHATLIVTTDADCFMGENWLRTLVQVYEQKNAKFIAAPVVFTQEKTFIQRFQTLDFMGMIVTTGASIYLNLANMSNGANLAYPKSVFQAVSGFEGIDDIASGDDLLLMDKIARQYPNELFFVKDQSATVYTYPEPNLKAFVNQRLRWASKSSKYKDWRIILSLAAVWFFNVSILLTLGLLVAGYHQFLPLFLGQLGTKCLADFLYLGSGAIFFQKKRLMWWFLPAQIAHILYIVIIGVWANFGKYDWKGRQVK